MHITTISTPQPDVPVCPAPPTPPPFAGPHPPSPTRRARQRSHLHVPHRSTANGGEGGIRTRGTVTRTHAFQACSFGHSDTSPRGPRPITHLSRSHHCQCEPPFPLQPASRRPPTPPRVRTHPNPLHHPPDHRGSSPTLSPTAYPPPLRASTTLPVATSGGEGGIRTHGPPEGGQRFSRPSRSTTPAPLRTGGESLPAGP
jgi:hypothetical protein